MADLYHWRRSLHIPVILGLQVAFIGLFAKYVIYDPVTVAGFGKSATTGNKKAIEAVKVYPGMTKSDNN